MEPDYVKVAGKSEIPIRKMKTAKVEGKEILIACVTGNFYAIGQECTHVGGARITKLKALSIRHAS